MLIEIFTDGAAQGNPGRGGYGIVMRYGKHVKEFSQGYRHTTNNRMELLAVIVALENLTKPGLEVLVTTDSRYVVDAVEKKWVFGWEKKGYKKKKNPDLWRRFLKVYRQHKVSFKWVKGHNLHTENERCDYLAVVAAEGPGKLIDKYYEDGEKQDGLFD